MDQFSHHIFTVLVNDLKTVDADVENPRSDHSVTMFFKSFLRGPSYKTIDDLW